MKELKLRGLNTMKTHAKTNTSIWDMDWRKQNENGYPCIPKGETVEIVEDGIDNMYGWGLTKVRWNKNTYLTKPEYLEN